MASEEALKGSIHRLVVFTVLGWSVLYIVHLCLRLLPNGPPMNPLSSPASDDRLSCLLGSPVPRPLPVRFPPSPFPALPPLPPPSPPPLQPLPRSRARIARSLLPLAPLAPLNHVFPAGLPTRCNPHPHSRSHSHPSSPNGRHKRQRGCTSTAAGQSVGSFPPLSPPFPLSASFGRLSVSRRSCLVCLPEFQIM